MSSIVLSCLATGDTHRNCSPAAFGGSKVPTAQHTRLRSLALGRRNRCPEPRARGSASAETVAPQRVAPLHFATEAAPGALSTPTAPCCHRALSVTTPTAAMALRASLRLAHLARPAVCRGPSVHVRFLATKQKGTSDTVTHTGQVSSLNILCSNHLTVLPGCRFSTTQHLVREDDMLPLLISIRLHGGVLSCARFGKKGMLAWIVSLA